MNAKELCNEVKAKGIPFDNHASDLYIKVNDESKALIEQYEFKENVTTFIDNIDHEKMV